MPTTPTPTVRLVRLVVRLAGTAALTVGGLLTSPAVAPPAEAQPAPPTVSPDDAAQATAVLAAEDRRLTEVRTASSLARWQGNSWQTPYRLATATGYTLVLTPASAPYTVDDLLDLAPQTFLRMSDGSYLLTEHIVVQTRATLRLSAPGGLTLRLASSSEGFSSIVSVGGNLELLGEDGAPVVVTSWDPDAAEPDTTTADGRAYLRAIGGRFEGRNVELGDLGFWSGRTGGLALTGTDRPNTGAITSVGGAQRPTGDAPSLLEDVEIRPAGPLPPGTSTPNLQYAVPASDYISARVTRTTIKGNTYGIFVSGASSIEITESTVTGSERGGIVLHRHVRNGLISRTVSSSNGGDGISAGRATTGITITESTAESNGGSGFRLSGRPLADGPSAVGLSLESYGNNSVSNSTAKDNARYGIEVLGGFNIGVQNNQVVGNDMGVMVSGPARRISVTGNRIDDTDRHGVALVNDVSDATVTGNVVDEAGTGMYLRDSSGEVVGNTVHDASSHGVSLVGQVEGTEVSYNVLAGRGASALDTVRSTGRVVTSANRVDGWDDTTPWYFVFKKLLQPMTTLWVSIFLLVVLSAVRGRRTRDAGPAHPYEHQMAHHRGHMPVPAPRVIDVREQRSREPMP